jgi:UDP-glucose 4-epimerase
VHDCKLVYAGSSTKFSHDENGKNLSPYAWSKSSNTELVQNYASWYGLKYAITYFYNVYGDNEISSGPYSTIVGIFKKQYLNSTPLTVVSPGTQVRNFTHVDDIVEGLFLVGEKGEGDEYGIGSDESYSVLDLANMFKREISWLPERRGNRRGADLINHKTKDLGWTAKKHLRKYIDDFISTKML